MEWEFLPSNTVWESAFILGYRPLGILMKTVEFSLRNMQYQNIESSTNDKLRTHNHENSIKYQRST